nr:MAG TPA_asm: hypothetical protein [Caudoviricetes sp.]
MREEFYESCRLYREECRERITEAGLCRSRRAWWCSCSS